MKFHGHEFTEDVVFGLGSGVDFMYFRDPGASPPIYVGGRVHNLEENICGRLGIRFEATGAPGPEEGWAAAKERLDRGEPVMVVADVYYLDYLRARRHFSAHRIVLTGYDDERAVAFVADNDRDEIQECSLANLARARSSTYPPRPAANVLYDFDFPDRLRPLEPAIRAAVRQQVADYLFTEAAEAEWRFGRARLCRGIRALDAFAREMPSWPGSMSDEALSLLCKSNYVSLEKGGTGYGGNFRRMYGRFLRQSAEATGTAALARVGDEMVAIGDRWSEMSLIFKEMSGQGTRAVELAAPIAREVHRRELEAFTALGDIAEGWPAS